MQVSAPPSQLGFIPNGVAGIRQTLKLMARLAKAASRYPEINCLALDITRGLPSYDYAGEITRLQNFVRDRIRYVRDIDEVETVRDPRVTLYYEAGDCDDKSTLLAALLKTIGFPCRFIAVGFDGVNYSHVLCAARLGTRWIPCETIVPNVGPGWFPPDANMQLVHHI